MIKNQTVSLNNIVRQGTGNIVSDMDGEKVMLSISKGKYYNLGEIGGEIWELIQTPILIEEVITTLTSRYDVEQSVCQEQVLSFLGLLANEGLIEVKES
ncbi:lasso peptide biosynthesis PqqD family chaperone [Anaerobacillus sp. CMMVII]|uniref:lasso peptide biosynthesis PqqD family chaperone n=1 Tax=Anaerobacillus sp. CMMVII TaxID=2755588 RepID=UPI0021B77E70|nr:lasso peptide biosynthesis PqqD family chaperone [Anaerobacillus sp. CMMVII]MCT8138137.1 lasso peptide biosynthesis PqqD family chaperone [Anaerobacillus sp. CMMVII]